VSRQAVLARALHLQLARMAKLDVGTAVDLNRRWKRRMHDLSSGNAAFADSTVLFSCTETRFQDSDARLRCRISFELNVNAIGKLAIATRRGHAYGTGPIDACATEPRDAFCLLLRLLRPSLRPNFDHLVDPASFTGSCRPCIRNLKPQARFWTCLCVVKLMSAHSSQHTRRKASAHRERAERKRH
jgi:hypothetical protein